MSLLFDEQTHTYTVDGVRLLSVTQYLKLGGFVDDEYFTEPGRVRGQAVHLGIKYLLDGVLDWNSLHPIIGPYVVAFERFLTDTDLCVDANEVRVCDKVYGYAGTFDLVGTWKLQPGLILIDVKTGANTDTAPLQTAAYRACLNDKPVHRYCLQLKSNKTYKLSKEFTDPNDIKIFRAIVATVNWKILHGLINLDRNGG